MTLICRDYEVSLPAKASPELLLTYEHSDAPLSTGARPHGAYLRPNAAEADRLDLIVECADTQLCFEALDAEVVMAISAQAPLVVCAMDGTDPVFVRRVPWSMAPSPRSPTP